MALAAAVGQEAATAIDRLLQTLQYGSVTRHMPSPNKRWEAHRQCDSELRYSMAFKHRCIFFMVPDRPCNSCRVPRFV